MKRSLALLIALATTLPQYSATAVTSKSISFTAEVWADNWFALYVNGKKVGEDSVSINTQKSFNSETIKFVASYPLTIGVIAKDYVQSQSGLEYLGTPNQQIGDGGLIFQIKESATKKVVAVSDGSWKTFVQNIAPLNSDCEKSSNPDLECKFKNNAIASNWASITYKDTSWVSATLFSAAEVGPKDGYFNISWNSSAKFIWGDNLKLDNVVYFRKKISANSNVAAVANMMSLELPNSLNSSLNINNTCDGAALSPAINWSGVPSAAKSLILIMDTIPGPARPGEVQIGNHYYIFQSNISPTTTGLAEGKITPYSPPCSQGPGSKEYRFFLYALSRTLPTGIKYDGAALYEIGEKESIAKAMKIYTYARSA